MQKWLDNRGKRVSGALLAGGLLHYAVGMHAWWPAGWLAPFFLLVVAFAAGTAEAAGLVCLAALIGLAGNWLYFQQITGGVVASVITLLQSLFWVFLILTTRRFVLASRHWGTVFIFPLAAAALDTFVSFATRQGTVGSFAYSQAEAVAVIQIAAGGGTPAIIFLTGLLPATLAVLAWRGRDIRRPAIAYGLPSLLLACLLAHGYWQVAREAPGTALRFGMAAVDDYLGPETPPARAAGVWQSYAAAIARLAQDGAKVVVLPEKIATLVGNEEKVRQDFFSQAARANRVHLLVGVAVRPGRETFNRAWLFAPDGSLLAEYDKHHLVPGWEAKLTAGAGFALRNISGNRLGIAICRDLIYTDVARHYGREGALVLAVPGWDFYQDAWMASQIARLRGVENGCAVVRASRAGWLFASDRRGRTLVAQASADQPGKSVIVDVPLQPAEPTFYARYGDVFGWACGALYLLFRLRLGRAKPVPGNPATAGH